MAAVYDYRRSIYCTPFLFATHLSNLLHTFPIYYTSFLFTSHLSYLLHTFLINCTPFLFATHLPYLLHTFPIYYTPFLFTAHRSYLLHIVPIYYTPLLFTTHLSYLLHTFPIYFTPLSPSHRTTTKAEQGGKVLVLTFLKTIFPGLFSKKKQNLVAKTAKQFLRQGSDFFCPLHFQKQITTSSQKQKSVGHQGVSVYFKSKCVAYLLHTFP